MKIRKRNGTEEDFNLQKIINAVSKANNSVGEECRLNQEKLDKVIATAQKKLGLFSTIKVEDIQDIVEEALMKHNCYDVARSYIVYRDNKKKNRKYSSDEEKILSICQANNEDVSGDNANKNPRVLPTMRDYIAGTKCKSIARKMLSKDIIEAHDSGKIHYHDMDYSPVMKMSNCGLVNLEDMFKNGFLLNSTKIDEPKSFRTACNLASQIALHVSSQQYGGQTMSWAHISKYVNVSRIKIQNELKKELGPLLYRLFYKSKVKKIVDRRLLNEIKDGVQTFQYQIITLQGTNGQSPFISMVLNLNEAEEGLPRDDLALVIKEVLRQRIDGVKNENNITRPVLFPKLLYFIDEGLNIDKKDKYYYLTEMAAKCVTKTMQPDFISSKVSRELKDGQEIPCMGCRSFTTPRKDGKIYGRFNQGVVTINIPYVAMEAKEEYFKQKEAIANAKEMGIDIVEPDLIKIFFKMFDERLELCHKALITRHESLKGTKAEVAPMLWQWGAYLRLKPDEVIDPYLTGDYTTISLGYVGLFETCKALIGQSNTSEEGSKLALSIMKYMNDKCEEWKNGKYSVLEGDTDID